MARETKKSKNAPPKKFSWRLPILLLVAILGALSWMHRDKWLPAPVKQVESTEPSLTPQEAELNATLHKPEIFMEEKEEETPSFTLDTSSEVSVLLYHDFSEHDSSNPMVINIAKFRQQMQAIHDARIPVISLRDYLDWRKGLKNIPPRAIVITIDDGWVGTYTLAMPVLKEFGYPFTLYLYTKYIAIGGRSMTMDQIREIMASGGEIGSHTISHKSLTMGQSAGPKAYGEFLRSEIGDSKTKLEGLFQSNIATLSYPYGNYNEQAVNLARDSGYEAAFTVNGAKCDFDTPMLELNRYVVHGNADATFQNATTFRGLGNISEIQGGGSEANQPVFTPASAATILDRSPLIQIDLAKVENLENATFSLKISGLGEITPHYDPATKTLSYQPPVRFHTRSVNIVLTISRKGESKVQVASSEFHIDPAASFLVPEVPKALPVAAP